MENVSSVQNNSYQTNNISTESSVKPKEEEKKDNNGNNGNNSSKESNIQKISDSKIIDITG